MGNSIKAASSRSVPYHLKAWVSDIIDNMLKECVIEEHPMNKPSLWVSCAAIIPKSDVSIYITHDACNVKMAIISTSHPIYKQEDI